MPLGRCCLSTKGLSQGVAVNPKDYLKAWLGSDLGTPRSTVHATRSSINSVNTVAPSHSTPVTTQTQTHTQTHTQTPAPSTPLEYVNTSLKRLSLITLQVDWTHSLSSVIENISPTGGGRKLSCFLNMKNCTYSENDLMELLGAYKTSGYEIIATNVPSTLHNIFQDHGVNFIMSQMEADLTLHPVPSSSAAASSTQTPMNIPSPKDRDNSNTSPSVENKLQVGTVRSGQQVYAEDCSLTVMGTVNEGAEIMSDGDIYVFGKLRGRAVAGLGAKDAATCRIYVTQFEASLIGIKSVFVVPEDHRVEYQLLKGKDVCITLERKYVARDEDLPDGVGAASTPSHQHGHGHNLSAPPICSIDCDDDYMMVFRPFL